MTTPGLNRLVILLVLSLASTAHAATFKFGTALSPEAQGATGTGTSEVIYDDVDQTLAVKIDFSGLSGTTTVAHIHAPTAVAGAGTVSVATYPGTFPLFPVGVTFGSYSTVIDLSLTGSYTVGFLNNFGGGTAAGAEAALIAAFRDGKAYVNVHSTEFPGGEIRGFLKQVPDSSTTFALFGASVLALIALRRRVRS